MLQVLRILLFTQKGGVHALQKLQGIVCEVLAKVDINLRSFHVFEVIIETFLAFLLGLREHFQVGLRKIIWGLHGLLKDLLEALL